MLKLEGVYRESLYHSHPLYTKSNPQGELITKQSDADSCNINNIIYNFTKTGQINHINNQTAQYLDLPDTIDYQNSLHIIADATEAFENLPALMRKKYDNDPAVFLDALQNPAEKAYLQEMGILKTPAESVPVPAGGGGGSSAADEPPKP